MIDRSLTALIVVLLFIVLWQLAGKADEQCLANLEERVQMLSDRLNEIDSE